MAYDDELTARYRAALDGMVGISEKRMMGAVCFFLHGNMIGGADRSKAGERRLMFRVGKDNEAAAQKLDGGTAMEMGGRRMSGFFFVEHSQCDDEALRRWLSLALGFVSGLPPK